MWGFIVALISGALMSIQGVFNTEVTKQTSLWVSTGWVQLSDFAVCVLAWLFTGRESVAALFLPDLLLPFPDQAASHEAVLPLLQVSLPV